ncbi:MAG TPA: ABC transporter permease [Bacteroidia bacterium]|nr:ABC transporter permease [Bacteroidia bacterium]
MFTNNFKIAWRNITRNKVNSFINIAGLAIGMASVILIAFYVQDELKYDKFFKNSGRIYQVNLNGIQDGTDFWTGNTPPTVGPALVSEIPEIESYIRIYRPGDVVVRSEGLNQTENYFTEKKILGVDSNFLQMFSYSMLEGNNKTCLDKPNSIVISEHIAKKYFGNSHSLGKILLFDNDRIPFTVTGILQNPPEQVSWQFDMLASISSYPVVKRFSWSWVWLQVNTYVKLKDNVANDAASIAQLETKFPAVVKKHAASAFRRIGQPLEEFYKKGGKWDFHLQPLTQVHLHSANIGSRIPTLSDIKYVYIFSAIALFIIVLACVNFMNLSTAQSARRAKEVGIRKVLGSEKKQLIKQFLSEAMLYSFIAAATAIVLVIIFLKPFNEIAGKSLGFSLIFAHGNWIFILGLSIVTGLLAGTYPAFYLTSFQPVAVLKGLKLFKSNIGNLLIRNGLVVFQFTVSTALIICTLVVYNQMQYMRNKDLGLNKENVIVVLNSQRLGSSEESFRHELTKMQEVIHVSITSSTPTVMNFGDGYLPEPANSKEQIAKEISLSSFIVDNDFIPALKIELLKGRNFSKEFNDSASVILNERAAKQIGWKDPVGMYMQYPGNNSQRFKVIGVTKDFNIQSLRTVMEPFALFHTSSHTYGLGSSYMLARVQPGEMSKTISLFENKWKSFAPDAPFDYSFLDEDFAALYSSEQRMGSIFSIFTVLSIFVGCLGLFGLAAYTAERRTKEIGVRKVLGASVQGLIALLSKDFIRLVLISAVIAFPIAWWSMNKWLEDFAYRITIEWWIFFVSALLALLIAFLTVSVQAFKAAVANPVKSLRTE